MALWSGGVSAGQRHEGDVFQAGAFHLAGTEHSPGIGEQDDVEQEFGVDGARAGLVVVGARVERREVNVLFDHVVDGVLQAAGDELGFERDGQHGHLVVVAGFVFGHGRISALINLHFLRWIRTFFDSFNGAHHPLAGGQGAPQ